MEVSGKTGCGSECYGLGVKVVLGHSLDSMPSKVVSTLDDSVMIVTLQGPGNARGHLPLWNQGEPCESLGPNGIKGPLFHGKDSWN